MSNSIIAERLDINIKTVKLCLSKFKESGIQHALSDALRHGHPVEITDDAVAWITDIACQSPADLGYSQKLWTLEKLHQHIDNNAEKAGFPRLSSVSKSRPQQLLKASGIKPFKIKYYCEKRDPDFESKYHCTR